MAERQYTSDELTKAISDAIGDRNLEAVTGLLMMLAAQDPERAQVVYDTIQAGLAIAGKRDG